MRTSTPLRRLSNPNLVRFVGSADVNQLLDCQTHVASGSCDHSLSSFDVDSVQVRHFDRCDLGDLSFADAAYFGLIRLSRALFNLRCFFEQFRRRRGFQNEIERAIFENRDFNRNDCSLFILGFRVVLFAELHDVHTMLTQSWTNRRCRVCFSGLNLQFDFSSNLFHGGLDPFSGGGWRPTERTEPYKYTQATDPTALQPYFSAIVSRFRLLLLG